ncbi:hypothetical protein ACPOL_3370 [Acidisarcina polymorpha]|uniref:Uncharacterized protein n=1 Tax=Acidisarcina polymorpha TaxID=2211140 RepID=A0A2Z5G0T7_9BACT|nr:hypothetical protein ACPOL_3370 [Acidisarcina polymorpha]
MPQKALPTNLSPMGRFQNPILWADLPDLDTLRINRVWQHQAEA